MKNHAYMTRKDSVTTCCEIIDVIAKSYNNTPDTMQINFINKKSKIKKWTIIFLQYLVSEYMFNIVNNHYY